MHERFHVSVLRGLNSAAYFSDVCRDYSIDERGVLSNHWGTVHESVDVTVLETTDTSVPCCSK